jgi:hypothetical protein
VAADPAAAEVASILADRGVRYDRLRDGAGHRPRRRFAEAVVRMPVRHPLRRHCPGFPRGNVSPATLASLVVWQAASGRKRGGSYQGRAHYYEGG